MSSGVICQRVAIPPHSADGSGRLQTGRNGEQNRVETGFIVTEDGFDLRFAGRTVLSHGSDCPAVVMAIGPVQCCARVRISVRRPVTAAAAAIAGLIRWVRTPLP